MKITKLKKIGILGGMGPFASSYFLQLLLKKISEKNIDMPEIILDSIPIKDFISDQTEVKSGLLVLKDRVKKMNKLGVNLIIMTCNTAHILYPQLSAVSQAQFPSLIDLVVNQVETRHLYRVWRSSHTNYIKN